MTYMRNWKSHRLTSHTWLGLNSQIGKPLSRIVEPLVYLFMFLAQKKLEFTGFQGWALEAHEIGQIYKYEENMYFKGSKMRK
jgi:hypothetical protein